MRGGDDSRLGRIDAVLLSHVHGDHIGDSHQPSANAGSCQKPDVSVSDAPNSNTMNVVLAKQAPLIVGGEMHFFFRAKVKSLGGRQRTGAAELGHHHARQRGGDERWQDRADQQTAAFQKAAKVPVHVPLSGKTMEFDGSGRCASGC